MDVAQLVTVIIILLLVATGVALLSRKLRVSYISGLVLAGLAITELLPRRISLDDSLILNVFLPILLFDAAININFSRLRSSIKSVAVLAGPGVIICSGVTAVLLKWGLGLAWIPALFTGVILAITDTVSVIAAFKEVSVPAQLALIVEGESLFNDGASLVLFSLLTKVYVNGSITILDGFQELFVVIVGGTLVGLALGYLSTGLFVRTDDSLSSILLTMAVALGANQIGSLMHVSGVVAVVVAGLVVGTLGLSERVSASSRLTLLSFWEYASFSVNSLIFLLIGIEVDLITFWKTLPAVLVAVLAYQVGRILSVYPLLAGMRWFERPIPWRWQHVLFLGNIKGSVSMALAISLPATLKGREQLIALVFGAVLVSVVGQGVSLPWLVKRLKLSHFSAFRRQTEELQAQLMTAKAAQDELDSLLKSGVLPKAVYEEMRAVYQVQVAGAEKALRELYNRRPDEFDPKSGDFHQHVKLDALRRRLLLAEKGALSEGMRKQILSEEIVRERIRTIDEQLLRLEDE